MKNKLDGVGLSIILVAVFMGLSAFGFLLTNILISHNSAGVVFFDVMLALLVLLSVFTIYQLLRGAEYKNR